MTTTPSTLDLLRKDSLTTALIKEIQALISAGEILPGERINESTLAQRFEVSRGPIREALQSLGAMGWLTFTKNRGASVRTFTLEEAAELYELRGALDELIARKLARGLGEADAAMLETRLRELDTLSQSQDVQPYYRANLAFHDSLASLAGNGRALDLYRSLVGELHLMRQQTLGQGGGINVSNAEHWEMFEAIRSGDEDRAAAAARAHIRASLARLRHTVAV